LLEIHEKIKERNNERIWKFKGLVIRVKNPNHPTGTFTVRGEVAGVTVEKTYPLSYPKFKKIVLLDQYRIRRAKLYYIREKVGKKAMKLRSILPDSERNKVIYEEK
jgi:large subunit ribosomal protein L19